MDINNLNQYKIQINDNKLIQLIYPIFILYLLYIEYICIILLYSNIIIYY